MKNSAIATVWYVQFKGDNSQLTVIRELKI